MTEKRLGINDHFGSITEYVIVVKGVGFFVTERRIGDVGMGSSQVEGSCTVSRRRRRDVAWLVGRWDMQFRKCSLVVQVFAKPHDTLAGKDTENGTLVFREFWRRITAVHLQIFPQERLNARQAEMGKTGAGVEEPEDAL